MKIGLVAPHIFMQEAILDKVIFSPGKLAVELADGLVEAGVEVWLFSPGSVQTKARNVTADLSYFERELAGRGDSYLDLLRKHPLVFVTLARQVQAELIARAFAMANDGELDLVHVYMNEEDLALPFAQFCTKPVVFTHHDPFNFLVKYKNLFPKYRHLNWVSMSLAQRAGMPAGTNWVGNVYHGVAEGRFVPNLKPRGEYVAYLGRIIEPKGVHLAIAAAKKAGLKLEIAGKHYSGAKDSYWQERIVPELGDDVEYVGFLNDDASLQDFLGNASALVVPSVFEEPFGMVMIEALACGTPVMGLDSGAIGEVVRDGVNGRLVKKDGSDDEIVSQLTAALRTVHEIDRASCRKDFEDRFTLERMVSGHANVYRKFVP